MKFLDAAAARVEIQGLLALGSAVHAAVAYWGDGAIDALGIAQGQDVRVVCDVRSGGCNAGEVRRLRRLLGRERVRTYDGLHAKVWSTAAAAVVGSSNASANGLCFEGAEAAALIEANVLVDEAEALEAIEKWWRGVVWPRARAITEGDLRRAAQLRRRIRVTRRLPEFPDLLTGLRSNPAAFAGRNLYVWVWKHEQQDRWVDAALGRACAQLGNKELSCWQDVAKPPPPGSVVIEFDSGEDPPAFMGMFQVLVDLPVFRVAKGTVLLCLPVDQFEGHGLGRVSAWQAAAAQAALDPKHDEWEAAAFAKRFLLVGV